MIKHIKTITELAQWWPEIKKSLQNLDSRAPKVDPNLLEQHVLHILSNGIEGWVGIYLDNSEVVCFAFMKRKLSLTPEILEYETILYNFKKGYKDEFFQLLKEFYGWAEDVGATRSFFETFSPKIFLLNRDIVQLEKHSIKLKKEF